VTVAGIGPEGPLLARAHGRPAQPALLRSINDRGALDLFLEHGRLSRTDIARMTGVSKPTASQVLARLEQARLVVPAAVTGGHPGRGAQLYQLDRTAAYAAAVDVAPRRIHVQVADITGAVVGEHLLTGASRASGSGPARALAALDSALDAAGLSRGDLDCVVLGAPGSYDADADRLKYARHVPGWQTVGLVAVLQQQVGTTVLVENDVNLAAVAERRLGAARETSDFFLLWVDDGIGGALVIDDRLHRGFSGGAGEVAFLPLPRAEVVRKPVRGNTGAFQSWVGPDQVVALAAAHGLSGRSQVEVVAAAAAQDGAAPRRFLSELAARYALGLSAVIAVVDPSAVILTGAVPTAGGELLRGLISAELDKIAIATPPVRLSTVAGNPVLTGALVAALDHARDSAYAAS
jgi:predicted NBD/HSP70 family sugar kinase